MRILLFAVVVLILFVLPVYADDKFDQP